MRQNTAEKIDLGPDCHDWQPASTLAESIGVDPKRASMLLAGSATRGHRLNGYLVERRKVTDEDTDLPRGTQFVYRVTREGVDKTAAKALDRRQPARDDAEEVDTWTCFVCGDEQPASHEGVHFFDFNPPRSACMQCEGAAAVIGLKESRALHEEPAQVEGDGDPNETVVVFKSAAETSESFPSDREAELIAKVKELEERLKELQAEEPPQDFRTVADLRRASYQAHRPVLVTGMQWHSMWVAVCDAERKASPQTPPDEPERSLSDIAEAKAAKAAQRDEVRASARSMQTALTALWDIACSDGACDPYTLATHTLRDIYKGGA